MDLNPYELKVISRLRKQQRQWPIARALVLFGCLLMGVFLVLVLNIEIRWIGEISRVENAIRSHIANDPPDRIVKQFMDFESTADSSTETVQIAVFFAVWTIFAFGNLYVFVLVCVNWRGHAEQALLLKLFDAHQGLAQKIDSGLKE